MLVALCEVERIQESAKGVGDGQSVDIPIPPTDVITNGMTQEDKMCALLDVRLSI